MAGTLGWNGTLVSWNFQLAVASTDCHTRDYVSTYPFAVGPLFPAFVVSSDDVNAICGNVGL